MASGAKSLRSMVEHWLTADPSKGIRVTEFKKRRSRHGCYVCVETAGEAGPIAMFFFRHGDGTWRVYPPSRERPALGTLETSVIHSSRCCDAETINVNAS